MPNFTLRNNKGASLTLMSYGATIQSLKIPVENKLRDIVLGFDSVDDYKKSFNLPSPPYFGALVGRFAGRIKAGKFNIENKTFTLNCNAGKNHLHGGKKGFSMQEWRLESLNQVENPSITLAYESPDLEENYPGILTVKVTYTLFETNSVEIKIEAVSTNNTILNLTNHSYFNLDGVFSDVTSHGLLLHSEKSLAVDSEQIPTGIFSDLIEEPFQFMIDKNVPSEIDTTFICKPMETFATLLSGDLKLKMTVATTQPAVHVYVGGNCFGEIKGKNQQIYNTRSGICFETQNFPDAPNHSNFPNCYLKPNEKYEHKTIFNFQNN
jgi:aldose 1-epimerase